ncbi:MAG: hypothetical protein KDA94_15725 [Acidimicrobiales bacterium]|nr:hypothetical protein [Acidimicrobiales bacterium]
MSEPARRDGRDEAVAAPSGSRRALRRSTIVVTALNLLSRATGFIRVLATASALGVTVLGDTYQRSNQVSNLLFELLAGGMLFSVLVPGFVDLLTAGDRASARRLAAVLSGRGLAAMAVLVALVMAFSQPLMALLSAGADPATRDAQAELGAFLLWFVAPQLLFYLVGAIASGLLQSDQRFAAAAFAPVCNNVVVTASMVAFAIVHDPARGLALTTGEKVLLGAGALAGTVAMTVVPLVAVRRAGLGFGLGWRTDGLALREMAERGAWGAGHVGLNEVLVLATIVLAGSVPGGVIAYQTAFTFFLLPHALLAHPIFTTIYPHLASSGTAGRYDEFADDLGRSLRSICALVLPAAGLGAVVAFPVLAHLDMGALTSTGTRLVAMVLAAYLTGLAGYSSFFLLTRASYALGDARTPTIVNAVATAGSIVAMALAAVLLDGTALLVSFGLINAVGTTGGSIALHRHVVHRMGVAVPVAGSIARSTAITVTSCAAAAVLALAIGWDSRTDAALAAVTCVTGGGLTALATNHLLGGDLPMLSRRLRGAA